MPDGWRGEVVDLSATGLRVRSVMLIPPGTEVDGALQVGEDGPVGLRAVVVWATPADHAAYVLAEMGLELIEAPKRYLDALAGLFAEQG